MRFRFILPLLLMAAPAGAQTARVDSAARPVYVQGTGGGVNAVRQRIQAIRGGAQRVIQPVIVVVSPPAAAPVYQPYQPAPAAALPPPLTNDERQALDRVRPGLADRMQSYYDVYRGYAPPVVVNRSGAGGVTALVTPPQADSGAARPDSIGAVSRDSTGLVPPPRPGAVAALPRAAIPSVYEVERAILETGLFRAAGVNFEFAKATLLEGAEALVDPVGEVLRKYPDLRLEVAGHTDSVGTEAFNQKLSQARAETVRQYLIRRYGIAPDRLVARGYGETQPLVTNENPTGRTLNRRVEFTVLK